MVWSIHYQHGLVAGESHLAGNHYYSITKQAIAWGMSANTTLRWFHMKQRQEALHNPQTDWSAFHKPDSMKSKLHDPLCNYTLI